MCIYYLVRLPGTRAHASSHVHCWWWLVNWREQGIHEVRIRLAHDHDLRNTTHIARMRGREDSMPRKDPKAQGYHPLSLHAITAEQVELIDRACAITGDTRTRFIVATAVHRARQVLDEAEEFGVEEPDAETRGTWVTP